MYTVVDCIVVVFLQIVICETMQTIFWKMNVRNLFSIFVSERALQLS